MNKKWWRYAIIGVLLFDLYLVALQAGSVINQGKHAAPWIQGRSLQNVPQEASFNPCSARTQATEKLTVTTIFLLTAMTLM